MKLGTSLWRYLQTVIHDSFTMKSKWRGHKCSHIGVANFLCTIVYLLKFSHQNYALYSTLFVFSTSIFVACMYVLSFKNPSKKVSIKHNNPSKYKHHLEWLPVFKQGYFAENLYNYTCSSNSYNLPVIPFCLN